jgi:hypothetical protein
MKFRNYEGWRFLLVSELPWKRALLLTLVHIRNKKLLDETREPEPDNIVRTMMVMNLPQSLRVSEAGIRLSVDGDCNEQRAANGQRFMRVLALLLWEDSEGKGDISSECFFRDIYCDTSKFSLLKKANLYNVLSSCCLSLFVAVNILENPDANYNTVQVPQSTSKPSSCTPLFQDCYSDFSSVVNWSCSLVSKTKTNK